MGFFALQDDVDNLRSEVAVLSERIDLLYSVLSRLGLADPRVTREVELLDRLESLERGLKQAKDAGE